MTSMPMLLAILCYLAVPFTYEWWIEVGKKAYWKAENLAWHSYYWEVADFCRSRAEDCEFKRHSR